MFAGKLIIVCLLAGVLTLGEFGVQMGQPSAVSGEPEKSAAVSAEIEKTSDADCGAGFLDTEAQMEEEYRRLEAKENETRGLLKEKEADLKAGGGTGQTEVMELQEELRRVQLQKIVLKSRIEEKSFDK